MSSIRKRLDEGWICDTDIQMFRENKGAIPLCCCVYKIADPVTYKKYPEPLLQCDQLEEPIPMSKFKTYCYKCQEYIETKLREMGK